MIIVREDAFASAYLATFGNFSKRLQQMQTGTRLCELLLPINAYRSAICDVNRHLIGPIYRTSVDLV